jgi:hypothetical protein
VNTFWTDDVTTVMSFFYTFPLELIAVLWI